MLEWQRDNTIPISAASKLPPEKIKGKIVRGILYDSDKPEFTEEYDKLVKRLSQKIKNANIGGQKMEENKITSQ
jgi:2-oxoglutarate ferredoxin oxidoreductase subunit beta